MMPFKWYAWYNGWCEYIITGGECVDLSQFQFPLHCNTGGEGGKDACQGDSGGPFVVMVPIFSCFLKDFLKDFSLPLWSTIPGLCTVQPVAGTWGSGQFWHWMWISVSTSQSIPKRSNSAQTFDNIYFTNFMVSSGNALPIGVENLCHRNRPGVFTRVSWFESWIKKVMRGIVSFLRYKEWDWKAQNTLSKL